VAALVRRRRAMLTQALAHHQAGRFGAAEALYRKVLRREPGHSQALHLLGVLAHQTGRNAEAIALIRRAIARTPGVAAFHSNLGNALWQAGDPAGAEASSRRALALDPDLPEAHVNLGNALWAQGRPQDAAAAYRDAVARRPDAVDAHSNLGAVLRDLGRFEEAAAALERALALDPDSGDAHNNLGVIRRAQGRTADAIAHYRRALAANPDDAEALCNLGAALKDVGDLDGAVRALEQALARRPDFAEAHNNLGIARQARGDVPAALAHYERALALKPGYAEAHNNAGNARQAQGQAAEALLAFERALALRPDYAEALSNRANALTELTRYDEAIASCERALALAPDFAEAWSNLGVAQAAAGRHRDALESHRRALALRPDLPEAHNNLGTARNALGWFHDAVAAFDEALALRPRYPEAHSNRGHALAGLGRTSDAVAAFRRALAERPDYPAAHSNLIFTLDLDPGATRAGLFDEKRLWNARYARALTAAAPAHANERDPERRLRVGYVSADFRYHSAAAVFGGVLLNHDRDRFDVACYSAVARPDGMTERFQAAAGLWRSTVGMSDEALAARIRADGIDVLVDLSGHSAGNRLLAFARRPAPVQVTAWGYAVGTGLDAMDYFLADEVTVPPDARAHFSEAVVYLPSIVCYGPPAWAPAVAPAPAREPGAVTFGCFNRLSKVTPEVLDVWARILVRLPAARLLMKFNGLEDAAQRTRILAVFAARGVDGARVDLLGGSPQQEHLAAYARVDVALDPFPHGGGVTALEGLWMGVPAITLAGDRVVGLLGPSFLTTLGLPELIARSADEYVDVAVRAAAHPDRLAELRAGLRPRMLASPLCDHAAYTRAVEAAYRAMWRRWVEGAPA
jgi:predicted O-linked N-acetylglucosamine transferase (SPINDLY family)